MQEYCNYNARQESGLAALDFVQILKEISGINASARMYLHIAQRILFADHLLSLRSA